MNISLDTLKHTAAHILLRYHVIIFVIVAIGGLIVVMLKVNTIIQNSSPSTVSTPTPAAFDQKTIDHIRSLNAAGTTTPLKTSGRSNPFSE
ncbi:MAG TPA: hypothetical protein VFQ70_02140 [Candidatus Saccharimonadaceae bacterium]|nr:hypothetical protein [Candidatus Saccharimonadaceae bacterium]